VQANDSAIRGLPEASAEAEASVAMTRPEPPPIDSDRKEYTVEDLTGFTGGGFITHVYRCILKREPDETGRRVYFRLLASGARSKAEVVAAVASSREAQRAGITVRGAAAVLWRSRLLYVPVLGPLVHWLAVLANLRKIERQIRTAAWRDESSRPPSPAEILWKFEAAGMARRLDGLTLALRRSIDIGFRSAVAGSVLRDEIAQLREFDLPSIPFGTGLSGARRRTLDALYLHFENRFRGAPEDIVERLSIYVHQLRHAGLVGRVVVDIGCGRGEWLDLLRQNGFEPHGVDSNTAMVEYCRARGLAASVGDGVERLASMDDASAGAVTAFHVVEHLSFLRIVKLFEEARRVIVPGGMLIVETPDPANVLVGSNTFYLDPTHRHPLPAPLLEFLARQYGFDVEVWRLHPPPDYLRVGDGEVAGRLNDLCYGPQDYAMVGKKR
jgi:SAM-dependent methyltransferase